MLVLTIIFSFLACVAGAFGIAGMGSARHKIRNWALPLFIASLVSAYFYAEWTGTIATAIITLIIFSVLTAMVNSRHHGLDHDRSIHQAQNFDVDSFMADMARKQRNK